MVMQAQREAVRRAYHFRCGYCSVHENETGSELEVDHHHPQSQGGTDDDDNLVYACSACNKAKGDFLGRPGSQERILHPRIDPMDEHLRPAADGRMEALTALGAFHIRRLRLNRPQLVALRQARLRHMDASTRITELESAIQQSRRDASSLERELEELLRLIVRLTEPER